MNVLVSTLLALVTLMTTWGELPIIRPDQYNRDHHWVAFINDHELDRRWRGLPTWIREADRYHERMPLWILRFFDERRVPFEDADRYWQTNELPFGHGGDVVQHLILSDPVIFGETQLTVRGDGSPWRYDRFQKSWLRYGFPKCRTILQAAFEAAKTEGIIHRALFYALTRRGDQLIGAAESSHVGTMQKYTRHYLNGNEWLGRHVLSDVGHPYPRIALHNGNALEYRWAGDDGSAFRSVHARVAIYLDEAAKAKGKDADETFANFFTRAMPGAERHLAAVPDGDRTSPFFEHCQEAAENGTAVDVFEPAIIKGAWALFNWSKDYQRPPFGGPERRAEMAELFGGEGTPKFIENWHGRWAEQTADSVFGWPMLLPRLRPVPAYRVVRITGLGDGHRQTVDGSVAELNPSFNPGLAVEGATTDAAETIHATGQWPIRDLRAADRIDRIRKWIDILGDWYAPTLATLDGLRLVGGIDAGDRSDPTVAVIASVEPTAELGHTITWRARLRLHNIRPREQADALYALEYLFAPDHGWGVDSTGAPPLLRHLNGTHRVDDADVRLDYTGYVLSTKTTVYDDDGDALVDHRGKPLKPTLKGQSVELMESDVVRGVLTLPWDRAVLREMPRYQRYRARGTTRYTQDHDDTVVAGQVLRLRLDEIARQPAKQADPLASFNPGVLAAGANRRSGL